MPLAMMLSKNRFMTCFETQVRALDSGAAQAEGYIYGDRPVVQLDMRCEAVFMRGWTLQYMPIGIKRVYGITDPPPAVSAEQ